MNENNLYIFDFEVFAHDWLVVFKHVPTGKYTIIWNDPYQVQWFMEEDCVLCGYNNKYYDNFILKSVLYECSPEQVKQVNDMIIQEGVNGWQIPWLRDSQIYFDSFDLMDDTEVGTSLKSIEGNIGISIEETEVDFNIDRPLTQDEMELVEKYCKYDVDATEKLYHLRQSYLENKVTLGRAVGLRDEEALYMTNAKLTAVYLKAVKPDKPWDDEREYKYPENLLREYIPQEVFDFYDRRNDPEVSNEDLWGNKLEIMVGDCPVTMASGGIHGAIPNYVEETKEGRTIRNKDVASYYPNIMRVMGYCSRNMPNPEIYAETIKKRVEAKKKGDKATADALKLVLNTTYGAMLNEYNDLYDPLMGRSVCITGQLFLLELSEHLIKECPTLKIIQLNTDGIMVSFDDSDEPKWQEITKEWEQRTGFELEEDFIKKIVQKDVNNYIEVPMSEGKPKIKGGQLVRGISTAGAFKVNNNANIIPKAVINYFVDGKEVKDTVNESEDIFEFQYIAKASSKYSAVYHKVGDEIIYTQKCNRVYASKDKSLGTLMKIHAETGRPAKISGLPLHCVIDNDNKLRICNVDRKWYIKQAEKTIKDFLGIKPVKKNTRKINILKKKSLELLGEN